MFLGYTEGLDSGILSLFAIKDEDEEERAALLKLEPQYINHMEEAEINILMTAIFDIKVNNIIDKYDKEKNRRVKNKHLKDIKTLSEIFDIPILPEEHIKDVPTDGEAKLIVPRNEDVMINLKAFFENRSLCCHICSFREAELDIKKLYDHYRISHPSEAYMFYTDKRICYLCGTGFMRQKGHFTEKHMKNNKYYCNKCGKHYLTKNGFREHLRLHADNMPYRCFLCPLQSAQRGNMKLHMRKKHSPKT